GIRYDLVTGVQTCALPISRSDRERPLFTGVNGPLMARRTAVRHALKVVPWPSPVLLNSCDPSGRGGRVKAREATACGLALTRRKIGRASCRERVKCWRATE